MRTARVFLVRALFAAFFPSVSMPFATCACLLLFPYFRPRFPVSPPTAGRPNSPPPGTCSNISQSHQQEELSRPPHFAPIFLPHSALSPLPQSQWIRYRQDQTCLLLGTSQPGQTMHGQGRVLFYQLEATGIIYCSSSSDSAWTLPLHMLCKKDGTWGPCSDPFVK